MADIQKFKEEDSLRQSCEATNRAEVMFFTNKQQVYKCRLSDFDDSKASVLGDYLPSKLGMEDGESVVDMVLPGDYSGAMLFFFENGKAARPETGSAYAEVRDGPDLPGKSRLHRFCSAYRWNAWRKPVQGSVHGAESGWH